MIMEGSRGDLQTENATALNGGDRKKPFNTVEFATHRLLSPLHHIMSLSSFFSSFLPTTYADAPAEEEPKEESKEEESKEEESKESDGEDSKDEPAEEEDEPEDVRDAFCDI
jgi:hypothetical protein